MSKSVMLRTSNEDIKLNIDNYPKVYNPNYSLTNTPDGWCFVFMHNNTELKEKFGVNNGLCYTNTIGTAFQIYIWDEHSDRIYIRQCKGGDTDLSHGVWFLKN